MKSVQTHRLSTPHSLNLCSSPSATSSAVKRLSRTSSSLSTSSNILVTSVHRLSCAPDDSAHLSLALNTAAPLPANPLPRPPMPVSAPPPLPSQQSDENSSNEDPLYEEIYSRIYNNPSSSNGSISPDKPRSLTASQASVFSPVDPPKLTPVSGVLHNKVRKI